MDETSLQRMQTRLAKPTLSPPSVWTLATQPAAGPLAPLSTVLAEACGRPLRDLSFVGRRSSRRALSLT